MQVPQQLLAGRSSLRHKKAVVVGTGAIGNVTAKLLAETGIGSITLIDRDFIDKGNLERQVLFGKKDLGAPKATTAVDYLKKLNKKTKFKAVVADLDYNNISELLGKPDIVLDCTDNFEARFLINDYCMANRIPWIYAGAVRGIGTVFNVLPEGPCFSCVFSSHSGFETCDTAGVSASVVNSVARIQAGQAVRILSGKKQDNAMIRVNGALVSRLKVRKNSKCKSCKGVFDYLTGKKTSRAVKLCGSNVYQIKGRPVNLHLLLERLKKSGVNAKSFGYCIHFSGMTLFRDGRAIIKASSPEKARSIYSRNLG